MICAALLAALFIVLHGPTGQFLALNAAEISSLREPIDRNAHWAKGVHCVIVMTNGKAIAVSEDCATVQQKLQPSR